ncbi:MAG: hypothetical protein IPO08_22600 [Xanthomonadales bacterium]|nr:hypothetical protein [Xanthomonadales bacterium]
MTETVAGDIADILARFEAGRERKAAWLAFLKDLWAQMRPDDPWSGMVISAGVG